MESRNSGERSGKRNHSWYKDASSRMSLGEVMRCAISRRLSSHRPASSGSKDASVFDNTLIKHLPRKGVVYSRSVLPSNIDLK